MDYTKAQWKAIAAQEINEIKGAADAALEGELSELPAKEFNKRIDTFIAAVLDSIVMIKAARDKRGR